MKWRLYSLRSGGRRVERVVAILESKSRAKMLVREWCVIKELLFLS